MSKRENERSQIESFLEGVGLGGLLPITLQHSWEFCNIWFGRLLTPRGDATAKILVYPLGKKPELIVEYEEEKASLRELTGQRWSLQPELVLEARTPDFGILVTCTLQEAEVFRRHLNAKRQGKCAESEAVRCSLSYHPQLDRLLGGDYFHEINGKWMKACLLSLDRAQYLFDLMNALNEAYASEPPWHGRIERPFPVSLAVLEIKEYSVEVAGDTRNVPIEELFKIGSLAAAPSEYHQLALMHLLVPDIQVVDNQTLSDREGLHLFTRQLFRSIRCGHSLGATFSRDIGCCIRPEFLTAEGGMTDLYFLHRPSDPQVLRRGQRTDFGNGLIVLYEVARSAPGLLPEIFHEAIRAYLGDRNVRLDLAALAADTAKDLAKEQSLPLRVPPSITVLVDSILGAGSHLSGE